MTTITRRSLLVAGSALSAGIGLSALPQPSLAQGAPRRGGVLRMSVDQAAGVLNPLLTRVNPEYLVAELLYSSLTRLAPDMSAEPDLAESWSASPDVKE
jgi:peptide/nickel transport system substrate-binding protein